MVEPHLGRQQRKAVACRGWQEDSRHVKRVEDLRGRVPQSGGGQEVDVEASPVADGLAAPEEVGQLPQGGLGAGRPAELLGLDSGQLEDRFGHGAAGIHEALQRGRDPIVGESHRADLDHSVSGRVETCGLEVEGCVFRHRYSGFYVRMFEAGSKRSARCYICARC